MLMLTSRTPWRRHPSGPVEIDRSSPLATGLAALWPVNNSTHLDLVTGIRSTTDVGRIATDDGWGLPFTGANGVNCGNRSDLSGLSSWTACAWVRDVSGTTVKRVLQHGDQATSPFLGIILYTESGLPKVGSNNGSAVTVSSSAGLPTNQWFHMVGRWDGATLKVYLNGIETGSSAMTGSMSATNDTTSIGYSSQLSEYSISTIGDCCIYRRALSASEIWALYSPQTRWSMYAPITNKKVFYVSGGGGGGGSRRIYAGLVG